MGAPQRHRSVVAAASSTRRSAHDPPLDTVATDGFRIYAFAVDPSHPKRAPLSRLPAAGSPRRCSRGPVGHAAAFPHGAEGRDRRDSRRVSRASRSRRLACRCARRRHATLALAAAVLVAACLSAGPSCAPPRSRGRRRGVRRRGIRQGARPLRRDPRREPGRRPRAAAHPESCSPGPASTTRRSPATTGRSRESRKTPRSCSERGKVLLWSKRYDEAIVTFDKVLQHRSERTVGALRDRAGVRVARTRQRKARPYYERALAAQPDMKEALLGLAYLDLADGDTAKALRRGGRAERDLPHDPEVVELGKQVRRARAAWVQVGWEDMNDSDENRMNTYRAEGGFSLPARLDLRFGYAAQRSRRAGSGPPARSRRQLRRRALYGVLGWQPRAGHRGELRLGAIAPDRRCGHRAHDGDRGAQLPVPDGDVDRPGGGGARSVPLLSAHPGQRDRRHVVHVLRVRAWSRPTARRDERRLRRFLRRQLADRSEAPELWYVWTMAEALPLVGGMVRYLDFSEDLTTATSIRQNLIAAVGFAPIRRHHRLVPLDVRDGRRSGSPIVHSRRRESVPPKPLWNLFGSVTWPLPHGMSFQFFAEFGNSSAASGPGYNSVYRRGPPAMDDRRLA